MCSFAVHSTGINPALPFCSCLKKIICDFGCTLGQRHEALPQRTAKILSPLDFEIWVHHKMWSGRAVYIELDSAEMPPVFSMYHSLDIYRDRYIAIHHYIYHLTRAGYLIRISSVIHMENTPTHLKWEGTFYKMCPDHYFLSTTAWDRKHFAYDHLHGGADTWTLSRRSFHMS